MHCKAKNIVKHILLIPLSHYLLPYSYSN